MGQFQDPEKMVDQYISQENKEAALKLLFELVVAHAKKKDFQKAEALRDRMFDIDPMALTEIIRSGEIIEEEKSGAIDSEHRAVWSKLYDMLTPDEANALFFALKNVKYEMDEVVYSQGEKKPRLYFVNNGRLKIVYKKGAREVLLKAIKPGQIAGEETFFSNSLCTTSMVTVSRVDLSYLDADQLRSWKAGFPVLESKLFDFVSRSEKINELIKAKELDRRGLKRIPVTGKVVIQLVSEAGNPVGRPFKGDICDVSQGGACFFVRLTKRETASMLLGQKMELSYTHPNSIPPDEINQAGKIVAVSFHPFEDCSIHLRFDSPLPMGRIEALDSLGPVKNEFED